MESAVIRHSLVAVVLNLERSIQASASLQTGEIWGAMEKDRYVDF